MFTLPSHRCHQGPCSRAGSDVYSYQHAEEEEAIRLRGHGALQYFDLDFRTFSGVTWNHDRGIRRRSCVALRTLYNYAFLGDFSSPPAISVIMQKLFAVVALALATQGAVGVAVWGQCGGKPQHFHGLALFLTDS
jgi:hypothetical protein